MPSIQPSFQVMTSHSGTTTMSTLQVFGQLSYYYHIITGTLNRDNTEKKQVIKKAKKKTQKVQTDKANEKKAGGKFLHQVFYQDLSFKNKCNKLGF